jgi:hypothetical protein
MPHNIGIKMSKFVKSKKISLKTSQEFNELWLQNIISEDPSILGLGDLVLKDKERIQPRAGRLDLLLQEPDNNKRYEVEIQLGKCDESHIIRTIEYWDIERKRYPNYEHCAVIIAEDITSRFLNIISLFNGNIPLIALQVDALQVEDKLTLSFTKVLDELNLGIEEEEETELTDRSYWENRATKQTVSCADEILKLINENGLNFELKYNKFYIGLAENGLPNNFIVIRPKQKFLYVNPKIEQSEEIDSLLDSKGIDFDYKKRNGPGRYRLKFKPDEIKKNRDIISYLIKVSLGHNTTFKEVA